MSNCKSGYLLFNLMHMNVFCFVLGWCVFCCFFVCVQKFQKEQIWHRNIYFCVSDSQIIYKCLAGNTIQHNSLLYNSVFVSAQINCNRSKVVKKMQ